MVDLCLKSLEGHRMHCVVRDCGCRAGQADGLFRLGWNAAVAAVLVELEDEYYLSDPGFLRRVVNGKFIKSERKSKEQAGAFRLCKYGVHGCYHKLNENKSCVCFCHRGEGL